MSRIIVSICSGAMASSSKSSSGKLLQNQVMDVAHLHQVPIEDFNVQKSVGWWARWMMLRAIKKMAGGEEAQMSILVTGKSHGAGKSWDLLRKHYKKYLSKFKRVAVVYVDAHSRIVGDGNPKKISQKRDLDRSGLPEKGEDKYLKIWNIFQRKQKPFGASMPTADTNIQDRTDRVDHFKIVEFDAVRRSLSEALYWLSK